jgi:hypothetical protein
MKALVTLVGAQGDAIARALAVTVGLRGRGHEVVVLGSLDPLLREAFEATGAVLTDKVPASGFDAAAIFSLGAPDRLAALARQMPTVLLLHESMLELMSLKGDLVHWVSLVRAARSRVFLSEYQRDKVFGSFTAGLDSRQLAVWSPSASPLAQPLKTRPEKDHFGIVIGGGFTSNRRAQDVVAAGERLREFNLVFTFVGDASGLANLPEGTRKVLARHPGRYVVAGVRTPAQTVALLQANDLYIEASADAIDPVCMIDAAACRLPLLISDIEPFAREWANGINCLKFPVNRPDFLASLTRMILQDDVLRNSIADEAKASAQRRGNDRYTAQTVQLIESFKK